MLRDPELILGRWVRFFSDLLNGESDQLDHSIITRIPQHPVAHVLGVEPTEEEMASALRSMANAKAVRPDELPVELLQLGLHHDTTVLREFSQGDHAGVARWAGAAAVARRRSQSAAQKERSDELRQPS